MKPHKTPTISVNSANLQIERRRARLVRLQMEEGKEEMEEGWKEGKEGRREKRRKEGGS